MNKLPETKQAELKKLSKVRLTSKLTQAGFALELLQTMDRSAMLEAWAKLAATGKDSEPTGAQMASLGYNIDLELQKIEFKKLRFQLAPDEKMERGKREAEREKMWGRW